MSETYEGVIQDIKEEKGNGPVGVEVLQEGSEYTKKFRVWKTERDTNEVSDVFLKVHNAMSSNTPVKITYEVQDRTNKYGPYKQNLIKAVEPKNSMQQEWSAPQVSEWEPVEEVKQAFNAEVVSETAGPTNLLAVVKGSLLDALRTIEEIEKSA